MNSPLLTLLEGAFAQAANGTSPAVNAVRTLVNSPAVGALVVATNNPLEALILAFAQTVLAALPAAPTTPTATT